MCCLYGLVDSKRAFNGKQKETIMYHLGISAEDRGIDATGIAYNKFGLHIRKSPVRAVDFKGNKSLRFADPSVIIGHTRHATQGNTKDNFNNHPFKGKGYVLAHNGVLYNEEEIREMYDLKEPKIKTDSYVAVQVLDAIGEISFNSLKELGEVCEGQYNFTVLDNKNNLWIVKGNNPMAVARFDNGLFLYASTEKILENGIKAIEKVGVKLGDYTIQDYDRDLQDGVIVKITSKGDVSMNTFKAYNPYNWREYAFLQDELVKEFGSQSMVDTYFYRLCDVTGVSLEMVCDLLDYRVPNDEIESIIFEEFLALQQKETEQEKEVV